jgi:hypothetical protein
VNTSFSFKVILDAYLLGPLFRRSNPSKSGPLPARANQLVNMCEVVGQMYMMTFVSLSCQQFSPTATDFQRAGKPNAVLRHFEQTWHKSKGASQLLSTFILPPMDISGRQRSKISRSTSVGTRRIGLSIDFKISIFWIS